jgi:hypothetical protein
MGIAARVAIFSGESDVSRLDAQSCVKVADFVLIRTLRQLRIKPELLAKVDCVAPAHDTVYLRLRL